MSALIFPAAAVFAFGIDRWCGEPPVRWHPVVWMGRYLGWAGRRLAPRADAAPLAALGTCLPAFAPDFKHFRLGAIVGSAGAAIVCVAEWAVQHGLPTLPERLGLIPGGVLAALGLSLLLTTDVIRRAFKAGGPLT